MEILVCIKRVPAPGARIVLTSDGSAIDTTHLAFAMSPHEECAVEEAVRLVAAHGGSATVLTVGSSAADEQLRHAISMGADRGVLVDVGEREPDPQATAAAIADAVAELEAERETFDLVLFGNESADAGNAQVGIRVAHALARPIVVGAKGIEPRVDGGGPSVALHRDVADGVERYALSVPAVVAVKEGINVPRYPALKGRVRAKKAHVSVRSVAPPRGGLETVRLRQPPQQESETAVLGRGADAASAVADVLEQLGVSDR